MSVMIKVLIINTVGMGFDGITNSIMNYYRFLDKSDMQIDFVATNEVDDRLTNQIEWNGGKVYALFMRNKNPFQYIKELTKIIKDGEYDIVHAHGNSCTLQTEMYAAKKGGAKVRIAHSRNTTCSHKIFHRILRPFFDRTYTHGFACGVDAGKWLFEDKRFTVITNGTDIEKFSYKNEIRQEYRKKYNLEGKKVIGHVGSFFYQKNHDFLIDIFYELTKMDSECVLFLMGDGDLRPEIESKAKELGIYDKIIFTGKTLEVPQLLQAMDVMVLPSRFEGLPNVAIEWQIACLPAILSDKVTRDAKITELVEFMGLGEGAKAWATKINDTKIIDRQLISEKIEYTVRFAGFDIQDNAKELKRLYGSFI